MKFAWTNRFQAQRPDLSMTFFGAPALAMRNLVREGEFIVPTDDDVREMLTYTSGGEDRIDIRKYDVFLIVALGFNMDMVDVMPHGVIAEQLELGPAERAISHACFDTIVRAPLETSPAMRLARDIRFVSTRPIYVCLRPFASEIILKDEEYRHDPRLGDPAYTGAIVALTKRVAMNVAQKNGCELIWQDPSTTRIPGYTNAEFGLSPTHLQIKMRETVQSHNHANEDYGAIVLTELFKRLDERAKT